MPAVVAAAALAVVDQQADIQPHSAVAMVALRS
jgi:hypothetical protein